MIVHRHVGHPRAARPLPQRALDARTASSSPSTSASTRPSGRFRTQPLTPSAVRRGLGEVAVADALHAAADQKVPSHTHRIETAVDVWRTAPYRMKVNLA